MTSADSAKAPIPKQEMLRRKVRVVPLACTIFFIVCGGPYSTEQVIGKSGPLLGLLILAILPVVWALPVALVTAEMSSAFPEEGGYYVWVKTGLGPFSGFLCAWWSWVASWVDLALYPLLAVRYAERLFPSLLPHSAPEYGWVLAIIVVLALANLLGISWISKMSGGLMLYQLLPFGLLVVVGAFHSIRFGVPHLPLTNPGVQPSDIGTALVLGLWNYLGWDNLSVASGEVSDAGKAFPKAIILGLIIVTAVILLPVMAGIVLKTDWSNWGADRGYWPEISAAALPALFGFIVVGGVICNVGQFGANLLASSRIPFVLALEGYLPKGIGRTLPRFGTPWVTILIATCICAALARDQFEDLLGIDITLYLGALMLEFLAFVRLRSRGQTSHASFRIPGGSMVVWLIVIVPSVVALASIWLQLNPKMELSKVGAPPWMVAAGFLLTGPVAFVLAKMANRWQALTKK